MNPIWTSQPSHYTLGGRSTIAARTARIDVGTRWATGWVETPGWMKRGDENAWYNGTKRWGRISGKSNLGDMSEDMSESTLAFRTVRPSNGRHWKKRFLYSQAVSLQSQTLF